MADGRSRAMTNFVIDVAIGVAFLLTGITGIVKFLPVDWTSGDGVSPLGVAYSTWSAVHDWSAVVMVAGVVIHVALHWRWVVRMARRAAGLPTPRAGHATSPQPDIAGAPATLWTAAVVTGDAAAARRSAQSAAPRYTRRRFLAGATMLAGAAAVGGVIGRAVLSPDTETTVAAQDAGANGQSGQASGHGADGAQSQTQTTVARVSVDERACEACGRCLQVCPYGVFAANGSGTAAVAADPDACRLCGHCVRVCPANAITLNG